jgi:hypothetical protein
VRELHRAGHALSHFGHAEPHRPLERLATIGGWEVVQNANGYRQTVDGEKFAGATGAPSTG